MKMESQEKFRSLQNISGVLRSFFSQTTGEKQKQNNNNKGTKLYNRFIKRVQRDPSFWNFWRSRSGLNAGSAVWVCAPVSDTSSSTTTAKKFLKKCTQVVFKSIWHIRISGVSPGGSCWTSRPRLLQMFSRTLRRSRNVLGLRQFTWRFHRHEQEMTDINFLGGWTYPLNQ